MAADVDRYLWFKTVVLPHEPALYARLRHILRNRDDAADVAAEAMARAYATADYDRIVHGRAFLYRIAHNLLVDAARRARIVAIDSVANLDDIHVDHGVEAGLHARDALRRVQAIVDSLPPQCRRVFLMRRVQDLSTTAIADLLGLSVSTVEKHLTKALARIVQATRDSEDAEDLHDVGIRAAGHARNGGRALGCQAIGGG